MIALTLPGVTLPSWNHYYSGSHWSKRRRDAAVIHEHVFLALQENYPHIEPFPEGVKVAIEVTVYFPTRRMLDPCNITAKLAIDGLLGRVIIDDSPAYVDSVTTRSRYDKNNPRVEIIIKPMEVNR